MTTAIDLSKDTLVPVEILWSTHYACPIYKVGDKLYIGKTGEYAGYFDEITDLLKKDQEATDE